MHRIISQLSTGGIDAFLFLFLLLGGMIFVVVLGILYVLGWWRVFEKAHRTPWFSLIPFLNRFVICDVGGTGMPAFAAYIISLGLLFFGLLRALEEGRWLMLFIAFVIFCGVLIWQGLGVARRFDSGPVFGVGLGLVPSAFAFVLGSDDTNYHSAHRVVDAPHTLEEEGERLHHRV